MRAAVVAGLDLRRQVADQPDGRRRRERRGDAVLVDQPQPVLGVELALDDDGVPERMGDAHEPAGTRVVERAGREVHVVGRIAEEAAATRRSVAGSPSWSGAPLPSAGRWCPTCRSWWPPRPPAPAAARPPTPPRTGRRRRRRRRRGLRAPSGSQARIVSISDGELGVDVDHRRVGVVDDVGRFLGREPVVEWDRGRRGLASGVHHRHHAHRVLPAPHDLVALADTDVAQHVGEPVGRGVELGERQDIGAPAPGRSSMTAGLSGLAPACRVRMSGKASVALTA